MKRLMFSSKSEKPFCIRRQVTFTGARGMALSQQTKSVKIMHDICANSWHISPLEVSRASDNDLGRQLSAFNLIWHKDGENHSLEQIFQSTKVFENGGPFTDVLDKKSNTAKKDTRFKQSGPLKCFVLDGEEYPLNPKGAFYNWIYIQALLTNTELAEAVLQYDGFTDIFFNPEKQVNCQAEACAIYVGLVRSEKIKSLKSFEDFIQMVYESIGLPNLSLLI